MEKEIIISSEGYEGCGMSLMAVSLAFKINETIKNEYTSLCEEH